MTGLRSLCVYCGSSGRVDERYKRAAIDMGRTIGEQGWQLVYGGGRVGLMGLCADACLEAGGRVVGIIPEHIQALEVKHTELHELLIVDSMHSRKRLMFERSDAFIVLPGGLGTLDETFEMITWRQLALHDKPIILVNLEGYWQPFLDLVDHMVEAGFCRPENRDLFTVVERIDEVLPALSHAPEPAVDPRPKLT